MTFIQRRTFLERLGLTTGAAILAPIVDSLVTQARGAVMTRKRFIVVTFSNGGWSGSTDFGDSGTTVPSDVSQTSDTTTLQTAQWTMLPRYAPLQKFRSKMLLVDGLSNVNGNDVHTTYDLLTCVPRAATGEGTHIPPGGQSLDQLVAPTLSREAAFPSIHLAALCPGPTGGPPFDRPKIYAPGLFAIGRNQPVSVQCSPADAFKAVFPVGVPKLGGGAPAPRTDLTVRKRVLDLVTDDVQRLRGAFAGPEREKLDQFLASIDEAQKRTALAMQAAPSLNAECRTPDLGTPAKPEEVFAAQMDLGTTAIACGMTNVLTVSFIGDGTAFSNLFPEFGPAGIDLHKLGHNDYAPKTGMYAEATLLWWSTQVARMADRLSQVMEGDRSILDGSIILFASDNSEFHHAFGERVPVVLLGTAGGKLRADGRYVRYPMMRNQSGRREGTRGAGDLMATVAQALGVPVDRWGTTGLHPERLQGPLAELL